MITWNLFTAALLLQYAATATAAARHDQTVLQPLEGPQPNIVFILTDDQDLHMNSLDYMPHLQKNLVKEGTFFSRHYATIALCCPSRVSLWTGRAAHNTNVTNVNPPYGKTSSHFFSRHTDWQVAIPNLLARASMKHGYHYGSKTLVTTHTTLASSSMPTLLSTTTIHTLQGSTAQTSYLIHTHINTSMLHFNATEMNRSAMKVNTRQMCSPRRHTDFLTMHLQRTPHSL